MGLISDIETAKYIKDSKRSDQEAADTTGGVYPSSPSDVRRSRRRGLVGTILDMREERRRKRTAKRD